MSTKKYETAEGVLRHDIDDGWTLSNGSHTHIRICDMFPDLDGKRVRVTVELIQKQCLHGGVFRGEKCGACGEEVR